jgi:tetratricopeptide (TPR) repeat protein
LAAGANFCTECGSAVAADGHAIEAVKAVAAEPEEQRCSRCKNLQPRRVCGESRSPQFQTKIEPKGRCDFFVMNPAQVYWKNGMIDALRGDRDAEAAAAFEAAISGGLPQDDELAARFALGEQYKQLVFNSGMEWQQCVSSRQFEEAIRQIGEALKIDREGGYGYFAEPLNRARLHTFDLMSMLGADAILERGDRPGAIVYLQQKVGLCSYLASCPLLNVLLKLGGLYLDEGRMESAQIMFTNVVAAEPVDRVDEQGAEQAIRAEAKERLRAIPSRR